MPSLEVLLGKPEAGALGKPKGKMGGDDEDAETMAAQDLIDAIKSGDAASVKAAFQRLYRSCSEMGGAEEAGEYE